MADQPSRRARGADDAAVGYVEMDVGHQLARHLGGAFPGCALVVVGEVAQAAGWIEPVASGRVWWPGDQVGAAVQGHRRLHAAVRYQAAQEGLRRWDIEPVPPLGGRIVREWAGSDGH